MDAISWDHSIYDIITPSLLRSFWQRQLPQIGAPWKLGRGPPLFRWALRPNSSRRMLSAMVSNCASCSNPNASRGIPEIRCGQRNFFQRVVKVKQVQLSNLQYQGKERCLSADAWQVCLVFGNSRFSSEHLASKQQQWQVHSVGLQHP